MTTPQDRVAVPTNGHHRRLGDDELTATDLEESTEPGATSPSLRAPVPTITPTQALVGFGIVAGLILLLLGRRRGDQG